jgi:DNA-binding beta-propeller fold protein YncE
MKNVMMASIAFLAFGFTSASAQAPHRVLERLSGPDGGWDYISVDKANHRVLSARGDGVTAFDISKPGAIGTVFASEGGHAAFAVNGGAEVLVTNGGANAVVFLDHAGKTTATIPTGKNPDAAIVDPKTGLVLVMEHTGGNVTLIDLKTKKVAGTIEIGGALEAAAVDGAGRAYVNVEDKSEIAVVDVAARKVVKRYALNECEEPTGIAYVAEGKRLIVACAGAVGIVSAETGRTIQTIKIGDGADGVAYDSARKVAYVPSGAEGVLNVLSVTPTDVTLSEKVQTQVSARTLTLDPETGRVYLPAAKVTPVPGQRPTREPGTFVII